LRRGRAANRDSDELRGEVRRGVMSSCGRRQSIRNHSDARRDSRRTPEIRVTARCETRTQSALRDLVRECSVDTLGADDIKDLMAHLGMATWMAQSLEQALTVWTVAERLVAEGNERRDGDSAPHFAALNKRTLGKLAGPRVDEILTEDPEFAQRLSRALRVRNDLVHRFHRRHAGALINGHALVTARQDCVEACDLFRPLIAEIMKRVESTGIDTGGVTVDDALAWAEDITQASLEDGIPAELTNELARLFAEAGSE
jgi:hypothetical protein